MLSNIQRIALRSDDPPPNGNNMQEADLVFHGVVVLELEQIWNDDQTRGTHLDGEIVDRVAIYREPGKPRFFCGRAPDQFIAEQRRYNPRVIFNPRSRDNPIPFFSSAKRFPSMELAADWLRSGGLASQGALRDRFEAQLRRVTNG